MGKRTKESIKRSLRALLNHGAHIERRRYQQGRVAADDPRRRADLPRHFVPLLPDNLGSKLHEATGQRKLQFW